MQPFEEYVKTVTPDPRFNYIVNDILRDKASRWSYNYYSNPRSQWHGRVMKHTNTSLQIEQSIARNIKAIEVLDTQIANCKLDPKDPMYKPLKKDEFEKIDLKYTELVKSNIYLKEDLKAETEQYDKYWHLDYIYSSTNKNMYALRNKFQLDGDLEYLKKGVTLTFLQQYARLEMSPPLESHSLSAW